MEMLFVGLGLLIPILLISAIVFLILKVRTGTLINFSYRGALRVYFYVVLLISLGLLAIGGVSTMFKVGFGEVVGHEFSYGQVYEDHRWELEDAERYDPPHLSPTDQRSLPDKVELAMKTSLINGVSLTAIGFFLLVIHIYGRRWVETSEERSDLLRRLYLLTGLVIFAIATIVALATGIPEALRYAILDMKPGEGSPGEPLSVAIVCLPVWLFYLFSTVRNMRNNPAGSQPEGQE